MARLHEYQGKSLLQDVGIRVPRGYVATSPDQAVRVAVELGFPVVIKGQAWVTSRAAQGLIQFATTEDEVRSAAADMLGRELGGFCIDHVLIEQQLAIAREFYAGVILDDLAQAPVLIFSAIGGSGIEDIAREHPGAIHRRNIDVRTGLYDYQGRELVQQAGIAGKLQIQLGDLLEKLVRAASQYDARSAEINPIVLTNDGQLIAADCRITIDDYAVYRHPELGIEVAREFDRPPTALERIAWEIEKNDYRGTFYFIQLMQDFKAGEGVIGFHGAGGGGSMMSMDALLARGFRIANFVDTSGNPPASKVYRAARVILEQGPIDGYFASGSGVASQEQFHSARGLAKAFLEHPLTVPAVIRLGGNAEEQAIALLERIAERLSAPLEAYGKDDSPEFCAGRLDELIRSHTPVKAQEKYAPTPPAEPYQFKTVTGGSVTYDYAACRECENQVCIQACAPQILELAEGLPRLKITIEAASKGGCTECLACQVDCLLDGAGGGYVHLPIPGLDEHDGGEPWPS